MKITIPLLATSLITVFTPTVRSDDLPDPIEVAAAMRKANDFYASKLASRGGYASSWKPDLSEARVEAKSSKTVISIQPPGTTTVGLAMLRAWQATGESAFLEGARGAARALVDCQHIRGRVNTALDTQHGDGYWLDRDRIDAELFVKHLSAMADYVKASGNATNP